MRNYFRLLHNINFGPQNDKYDELVRLLLQSDVDISDINILKNESDTIVPGTLREINYWLTG